MKACQCETKHDYFIVGSETYLLLAHIEIVHAMIVCGLSFITNLQKGIRESVRLLIDIFTIME